MKYIAFIILMVAAQCINAGAWKPEIKFTLEISDFMQTLTWISGVSYALTQSKNELKKLNKTNFICNAPSIIGSQELIAILNFKHAGHKITSEKAITTIMQGLKEKYPCI